MTEENSVPKESAIVEVNETTEIVKVDESTEIVEASQQTTEIVTKEMPANTPEQVIKETAALFEAIKKRAEAEFQSASELTREAYMNAINKAREAIEQNQASAKERVDQASEIIKKEAEKNWLLVDAIKTRAQSEIQSAGNVTLENYLKSVRQAREAIEQNKSIEKERIEQAVQDVQKQAEKNWQVVASEIESFGVRLADAAKNAWNSLMAYFSK
ncbi:MAG TPA: hypothetical protein V6D28_27275 [Leptolyngbyaceae cyanobacterium]